MSVQQANRNIEDLQPVLQRGYKELIKRWNEKPESNTYGVGVAETLRTLDRQKYLVSIGASQTLQSNHLRGLAFDVYLYKRSEPSKTNYDTQPLTVLGNIWTEMGGEWGGSWKGFVDMPHFEYTKGDKMPWEITTTPTNPVTNKQEPSNFAKEAWAWAIERAITDGTNPHDVITREQVATMLHRYHCSLYNVGMSDGGSK